jgi:nucleotide-binding universal stress UspA family protein
MLPFRKILCSTDYSEPSYEALARAWELAGHFGAELCVLHVVPVLGNELGFDTEHIPDYERERLAAARQQLCELIVERLPTAVRARPLVRLGNPAEQIARVAGEEKVDLIVIATHGATGWRHLVFGSVTERVLRMAQCPLFVVHAPRK